LTTSGGQAVLSARRNQTTVAFVDSFTHGRLNGGATRESPGVQLFRWQISPSVADDGTTETGTEPSSAPLDQTPPCRRTVGVAPCVLTIEQIVDKSFRDFVRGPAAYPGEAKVKKVKVAHTRLASVGFRS